MISSKNKTQVDRIEGRYGNLTRANGGMQAVGLRLWDNLFKRGERTGEMGKKCGGWTISFALLFFRSAWLDQIKTGSLEEEIHTVPAECLAHGERLYVAATVSWHVTQQSRNCV
jgi:hypothetical protein